MKEFNYKNVNQVPRLKKVVLNCGVGEAVANGKAIEHAVYGLTRISGQKPVITRAKKSIAGFKLREGMPIGCSVTLRKERMESFTDRLFNVALPRVRRFRGASEQRFDGRSNYTMGLTEQIAFPEVEIDKLDKVRGLNITFVTTAENDEEARSLLSHLGMPFRK